ncbi:MAG TPA: two-component regulator propeller domain-containing protein [Opitutaceae bacterium]|nr:two-component regulator propeller domain-containing protein [Opitutaceae bacterium]
MAGPRGARAIRCAAVWCLVWIVGTSASARTDSFWRPVAGLPAKTATALQQTRDGYLWIGTYEGLIRYDGVDSTLFDNQMAPASHDVAVTALYEAPDGTLWIGHEHGAVSSYKDGKFTEYPARPDWKADRYHAITSDDAGDIWLLDRRGELARLRDNFVLHPEWGGRDSIWGLVRSRDGRIWVINGGRLSELVGAELHVVSAPPDCADAVQAIVPTADGDIWGIAAGRLWQKTADGWTGGSQMLAIGDLPVSSALATVDGRIYLTTYDRGTLELLPGEPRPAQLYGRGTGLPSSWVLTACEDHEGGVWLGTGRSGVLRLQQRKVTMLEPSDAWHGRPVLTLCGTRDGGFLVGTEGAGLYRMRRDGSWSLFNAESGLQNCYIWAVHEDNTGKLWAGTWRGLECAEGTRFSPAPGTGDFRDPVSALAPARTGGLWVGGRPGLAHYAEGQLRWIEPEEGRKLRDIRSILEAPDGTVWVSTSGRGIGRIRDGEVRQFTAADGLGSVFTHGLLLDEDGSLWIATRGGGLNRLKNGRFAAVRTEHGLGSNAISQLEDDGLGYLWMSSREGIFRVSKAELNACADGTLRQVHCQIYGPADGLPAIACSSSQPAPGCRTADGRLVFATDAGLALIDPRNVTSNTLPPAVVIESVRSGERREQPAPFPAEIKLGPGAKRIEIKYTGLSYAQPEKVRFRSRLEGFESEWVDMGTHRRAMYSYLPPGRYVFHVTASNNDGVWNKHGRALTLVVAPHLWQTLWFRLLFGALAAGAIGTLIWFQARRRLLRRVEMLERERAIDAERTRIANDMHDDIGAGLTRINLLSGTASTQLGDLAHVEQVLRQIHETARSITRAVDEIVWAVNPRHDTLESVVNYLERIAQDMLGAAKMQCRLDLPVDFPNWRPSSDVRHQLCLAYKEALSNAVRHSGGRRVTISFSLTASGCVLIVADDGRGPVPAAAPAATPRVTSGNGIPGMQRRLARIGGTCEIRAGRTGGTDVVFFVPTAALARR